MKNDKLWFIDGRADVHLSNDDNRAGLSVIEHRFPYGASPPRHVHHDEVELFYLLEGSVRFDLGDATRVASAGELVHIPARVEHSFRVLSPGGARVLTVTNGGFEAMLREVASPAANDGLPEGGPPTMAEQRQLAEACLRHGLELTGPPLAA